MNKLQLIGAVLYWTEGTKAWSDNRTNKLNYMVRITNTNPEIIRIFTKFLRTFNIDEKRIRLNLVAHPDLNLVEEKKFWYGITKIPLDQWHKIQIRKLGKKGKCRHGICSIVYSSKELYLKIQVLIDQLTVGL